MAAAKAVVAQRNVDSLQDAIKVLQGQLRRDLDDLGKLLLTQNGVGPCTQCGRHVSSPCDTAEGFHQEGPWDSSCREFFS